MKANGKKLYAPASSSKRPLLQHADVTAVGNKEEMNIHMSAKKMLGCQS